MIKDIEKNIKNHIRECIEKEIDGIMVGDIGVLSLIKEIKNDIKLYSSTYMITTNTETVNFLMNLGFNRVTLDRQLTIDEIRSIIKNCNVETEVFVHGGGCSNINGNCYLYHFKIPEMMRAFEHSGTLKSPCLMPFEIYDNDNMDKIADLPIMDGFEVCSLCNLLKIVETGVNCIKIVGRCDAIYIQESTTHIYRKLLNLLKKDQMDEYRTFLNNMHNKVMLNIICKELPNLKQSFCEQERCYYNLLTHSPYKIKISWQAWTKQLLKRGKIE
jgi:putative protease